MPDRKRAAIYTRQSLDKDGDGAAVARQEEDGRKLCAARGWDVAKVLTDNSLSAFSGKPRPGYDELLCMITSREIEVVIAWAIDRLTRSMSDLETLIRLCEEHGVMVVTVSGDLDLSTDQGRLVARILGSVARGEVERKSARQRRANEQRAARGEARKACPRPFGWQADRISLEPAEAEAIREGARAILGGGTLSGITRDWTARGVRPVQSDSGQWTCPSVRSIMLSPRIAGIATYKGERIETEAAWEPILTEETWTAVRSVLMHPSRQRRQGVRTMLGGLARCRCGSTVSASSNQLGQPVYRCTRDEGQAGPHVAIRREPIDAYIELLVLSHAEAAGLAASPDDGPDVVALRDEAQAIRANLDEMAADRALGLVTRSQMIAATERGNRRLAEIETELDQAGQEDAFALLVAAENAREAWKKLTVDRRRAIVAGLCEVTLHPAGRGRKISADPLNLDEMGRLVTAERR